MLLALVLTAAAKLDPSRRAVLLQAGQAAGLGAASRGAGLNAPAVAATSTIAPTISLPEIGIGAWSWGDSFFWGYDQKNDYKLRELFEAYASTSHALIDSAEVYGFGRSETLIGEFERASSRHVQVATKFAALPWRTSRGDVVKACRSSLKRLGRDSIELYQIHFPK